MAVLTLYEKNLHISELWLEYISIAKITNKMKTVGLPDIICLQERMYDWIFKNGMNDRLNIETKVPN